MRRGSRTKSRDSRAHRRLIDLVKLMRTQFQLKIPKQKNRSALWMPLRRLSLMDVALDVKNGGIFNCATSHETDLRGERCVAGYVWLENLY